MSFKRGSWTIPVLLLIVWGSIKIPWESKLSQPMEQSRLQEFAMSRQARDQIGQGMTLALLSGFRAVIADYFWLKVNDCWENQNWLRLESSLNLVTTLQPHCILFWEMGSWHLAWNAAIERRNNPDEGNLARRIRDENLWIDAGRRLLERGIASNPDRHELWLQLAWLFERRWKNPGMAAYYYEQASKRPGAPVYIERFAGYALEKADRPQEAYEYWKKLWNKNKDSADKPKGRDKIEERIRHLESRLSIPPQDRIFK